MENYGININFFSTQSMVYMRKRGEIVVFSSKFLQNSIKKREMMMFKALKRNYKGRLKVLGKLLESKLRVRVFKKKGGELKGAWFPKLSTLGKSFI